MIAFSASGCALRPEAVEAAPGDAHHADLAVRPGLRAIHLITSQGVVQFLFGILVLHQAFGVAIAAHIDPQTGIAVAGKVGMGEIVAGGGAVAFAIGQELQNCGNRILHGIFGHPDPRRKPAAVGQYNAHIRLLCDYMRKSFDHSHTHLRPRADAKMDMPAGSSQRNTSLFPSLRGVPYAHTMRICSSARIKHLRQKYRHLRRYGDLPSP